MRVAMIGQKGVPATWGGVERHVEELGAELAALGHEVTVFTRPHYADSTLAEHRGMRLVSVPTIHSKHLDAIVHSFLCSLRTVGGRYDVVHYHGIGPCLVSPIARLRRGAVVATIHGQDWRGGKWGRFASWMLRMGEALALRVPQETIAVSAALAATYGRPDGRPVHAIPSGVAVEPDADDSVLEELGVERGTYLLFVGRLVPEKGLHVLLEALGALENAPTLVVAGDTSLSDDYVERLRVITGAGVVWAGYRFGSQLASLYRNARLLVAPSTHEGLPIVLLESLAYGCPAVVSDIPPMREVLREHGCYATPGDAGSLACILRSILDGEADAVIPHPVSRELLEPYRWPHVASEVVEVYERALAR